MRFFHKNDGRDMRAMQRELIKVKADYDALCAWQTQLWKEEERVKEAERRERAAYIKLEYDEDSEEHKQEVEEFNRQQREAAMELEYDEESKREEEEYYSTKLLQWAQCEREEQLLSNTSREE